MVISSESELRGMMPSPRVDSPCSTIPAVALLHVRSVCLKSLTWLFMMPVLGEKLTRKMLSYLR